MSWIDLHEGILEEFSERASFDDNEFLRGNGVQTFVSNGSRSNRSTVCVVCERPVDRKSLTCSKRCTQARRRAELVVSGVCTKCKVNKTSKISKECATCSAPVVRETRKVKCGDEKCGAEFDQEIHGGQAKQFCSGRCRDRVQARRRIARRKTLNSQSLTSTLASS